GAWLYSGDDLSDITHFDSLHSATFSPDGRWLIGADDSDAAQLFDANTFESVTLPDSFQKPAFSPDGRWLLGSVNEKPVLLDAHFQPVDFPAEYVENPPSYFRWSPDSHKIMAVNADNNISIWKLGDDATAVHIASTLSGYPQWSPDSRKILSNDPTDNRVQIWDADSGERLMDIPAQETQQNYGEEQVYGAVVWTPESAHIIRFYPSNDSVALQLCDVLTGKVIKVFQTSQLFNVWFSPDGQKFALNNGLYDAITFEKTARMGAEFFLLWSPDSRFMAVTATGVADISILDGMTGTTTHDLKGHIDGFGTRTVIWSPDSTKLVSWDDKGQFILWDAVRGELLKKLDSHVQLADGYNLSSNGQIAALPDSIGKIRLLNLQTGQITATLTGHLNKANTLLWQPGGNLLATQNSYGGSTTFWNGKDDRNIIYIWDSETGERVHTIRGFTGLASATWSPDGKQLLVGNEGDNSIVVWDAATNTESTIKVEIGYGYAPYPTIIWSPDQQILLLDYNYATHGGQAIRLYDTQTGEMLVDRIYYDGLAQYNWDKTSQRLRFVATRCIYYGSNCTITIRTIFDRLNPPANKTYNISDVPVEMVLGAFKTAPTLSWSSDGRSLAVTDGQTTWIWDIFEQSKQLLLTAPHSNGGNWSPNGSKVAVSDDTTTRIWQIRDHAAQLLLTVPNVGGVVWSPNSQKIATRGINQDDWHVEVFDLEDGRQILNASDKQYRLWSVDSRYVVLGENPVFDVYHYIYLSALWDTTTNQQVMTLDGLPLVWSLDGSKFVELSGGMIRVWARD
ncbi:MAG: WD40 repeat domain-containing protein, partial [Chloroflexota bacterium]